MHFLTSSILCKLHYFIPSFVLRNKSDKILFEACLFIYLESKRGDNFKLNLIKFKIVSPINIIF